MFKRYNIVDECGLKTLVNPESVVKKWSNSPNNPTEDHSLKEAKPIEINGAGGRNRTDMGLRPAGF